jgi:hypothetical protein
MYATINTTTANAIRNKKNLFMSDDAETTISFRRGLQVAKRRYFGDCSPGEAIHW